MEPLIGCSFLVGPDWTLKKNKFNENIQIPDNTPNVWWPWSGEKTQPFWEDTNFWLGQCVAT